MQLPITEIVIASLMSVAMLSTDTGSIAGIINGPTSIKAGEQIEGRWTSYSPTRFGASNVEFFANRTCQFNGDSRETFPCRWQEAEAGHARIEAQVSGRYEIFLASIAGDYMVVKEAGRETPYVRANSKAAFERQRIAQGPSDFLIPNFFVPDQK